MYCPLTLGCVAFHFSVVGLPVAVPIKRTRFPSLNIYQLPLKCLPIGEGLITYFDQFLVPVLFTSNCLNKFIWKKVERWNNVCAYDDKSLEVDLEIPFTEIIPFSRTIVLCSSVRLMTCLVTGSQPQQWYQVGVLYCGVDNKSNQNVLIYSYEICATIAPVDMSCQASCCSLQGFYLWKNDDHISSRVHCTSNTIKGNQ